MLLPLGAAGTYIHARDMVACERVAKAYASALDDIDVVTRMVVKPQIMLVFHR